jgi:hypothetical protein
MIKIVIFVFVFFFGAICGYGFDLYIAPISFIDKLEDSVTQDRQVIKDIIKESQEYTHGIDLFFKPVADTEINAPQSILDAITICRNNGIEYLLYGYLEKGEYEYRVELKLLDFGKKEIVKIFYSSDGRDDYKRLIKDIGYKVISYFDDLFGLKILEKESSKSIINIPVSIGYWTPLNSDWRYAVIGIFSASAGISIIPDYKAFIFAERNCYLVWDISIEYQYGTGKEKVELESLHNIIIRAPVRVQMLLNKEHEIFFGLGVSYTFSILNLSPLYEDEKRDVCNFLGFIISAGYEWRFSDKISFGIDNIIDIGIQKNLMVNYSPRIRFIYEIYSREKEKI